MLVVGGNGKETNTDEFTISRNKSRSTSNNTLMARPQLLTYTLFETYIFNNFLSRRLFCLCVRCTVLNPRHSYSIYRTRRYILMLYYDRRLLLNIYKTIVLNIYLMSQHVRFAVA